MKFLDDFNLQQKIGFYILSLLIIGFIIFQLLIEPIFNKNKQLSGKIYQQQQLNDYLIKSNNQLKINKIFVKLNTIKAKSIINQEFKNIQKTSTTNKNMVILNIKSQNFAKILQNINSLRNKYGIVVVEASIKKQEEGLVNAKLFFKHP